MISIDKRLTACADMVRGDDIVCDIGTDHAYLPVYLLEHKLCKRALASDISEGPLSFARQTVEKYGFSNDIIINKSDGVEGIDLSSVSDIVIAGMGGETISDILSRKGACREDINYIFQPMTRAGHLRRWLYKNGFEILRENAVSEDGRIYTVINAVYTGVSIDISRTAEVIGRVNVNTDDGREYCGSQYRKMMNIAAGLAKAGKTADSKKYEKIAARLDMILKGRMDMVSEVYRFIDSLAPFSRQEKWDNSGLLVGSPDKKVSRAMVCLDITAQTAQEAVDIGAELVISHHPVIFHPLRSLADDEPALILAKSGISAICVHTPFDIASGGMNDILMELSGFEKAEGILEVTGNDGDPYGLGTFGICDEEYTASQLAGKLRDILGCTVVRYTDGGKPIKKAAFCTGSGGDIELIDAAVSGGAQAYITSEVHHDRWLYAKRLGLSLFDCGHYHTEVIGMRRMQKILSAEFSNIEFVMAQTEKDPVSYAI